MSGWVYVMSNGCPHGLVKIGRTNMHPEDRAKQLSAPTGVPNSFAVLLAIKVREPVALEAALHEVFRNRRLNDSREFFNFTTRRDMDILFDVLQGYPMQESYQDADIGYWLDQLGATDV